MSGEEMAQGQRNDEGRARELRRHAWVFLVANGLLWLGDLLSGGGIDWAVWITALWSPGLATHVLVCRCSEPRVGEHVADRPTEDEMRVWAGIR